MFDTVPAALEALRAGDFVVVLDDADRENEGDLVIAAQHATSEKLVCFCLFLFFVDERTRKGTMFREFIVN